MADISERDSLRKELENVLKRYGTGSAEPPVDIPAEELRQLRDLAYRIVAGDFSGLELGRLSTEREVQLAALVQELISLKSKASLQHFEETNPYVDVLSSRIIRDGANKEND